MLIDQIRNCPDGKRTKQLTRLEISRPELTKILLAYLKDFPYV